MSNLSDNGISRFLCCFNLKLLNTHIKIIYSFLLKRKNTFQGRRNGFQNGVAMEHWKVLSATMFSGQEKFLMSRRFGMAKIATFWSSWQPFNSFYLEALYFFPLFLFFLLVASPDFSNESTTVLVLRSRRHLVYWNHIKKISRCHSFLKHNRIAVKTLSKEFMFGTSFTFLVGRKDLRHSWRELAYNGFARS